MLCIHRRVLWFGRGAAAVIVRALLLLFEIDGAQENRGS